MRDVIGLLEAYGEHAKATAHPVELEEIIRPVDLEDIMERRPAPPLTPLRSRPRWVVALVAAVVGLILIGGIGLLMQGSGEQVITQPDPEAITLVPTEVDPVHISTVFGDIEFTTWRFPPDIEFHPFSPFISQTSTTHGLVALDDGELWWSADYATWHRTTTWPRSRIPAEAARMANVGDDIVVFGTTSAARFAWDGDEWALQSQFELPFRIEVDDPNAFPIKLRMAFGPRGTVAASATTIYYAPDGVTFSEAQRGPDLGVFIAAEYVPEAGLGGDCRTTFGATSAEIQMVVATDAGFVAFTSATHGNGWVCAPLLWFSADGIIWELVSPNSPFGEPSVFERGSIGELERHIVEREGRFVAVGEFGGQGITDPEGAVWVSDNALAWERAEVALARADTLDAGEMGWMLTGTVDERDRVMWFSIDGSTWDGPHELPEGLELETWGDTPQFAVGSDAILAVGPHEQIHVIGRIRK